MYSIRNRLNYTIIFSMIVLLSLAAFFIYVRVSGHVENVFDTALFDKANALISLTELDEEGLEFDFAEKDVMFEFKPGNAPQYYQVWDKDGELLIRSPSLEDRDLPIIGTDTGQHQLANLQLPDGRPGRLIEITFIPRVETEDDEDDALARKRAEIPPAQPITLVYAREREALDATLFATGLTIFGAIIAVLVFSALLIRRLVDSGLSPLSSLARQVGEIGESNLEARLTHEGARSIEIAPIENQLNHLLERLQSAFEREKRFSANVAHELRTPLSELKTLAEVGRMLPAEDTQIGTFFNDVGEISGQMEKVVFTLLELARSEAGLLRSDPEDIELSRYCDEIWQHAINGGGTAKSLVKTIPEGLVINTDREKLGMILSNLFSNAISYSPENAEVQLTTEIRNKKIVLEVRNASTDLRPEDIVHMKDRFWRRHKTHAGSGHSGLGLTLVDALARILQLEVSLQLDSRQVFRVRISGLQAALHGPG